MSIYKPSNCAPFLEALDLTQPQSFQCEINTSNIPITGYKIRILDNNNNIIFEGIDYSPLPSNNTGLNGSLLNIPVIVTDENDLNYNTIYYDSDNDNENWYYLSSNGQKTILSNFSNGYINQPYKWQITLAQGLKFSQSNPLKPPQSNSPDSQYYDMIVTTGQVLGSIPNRIQGPLSENIYKDYYIQLCSNTYDQGATPQEQSMVFVGDRVRISSYDQSFGYIYPEEGVFTQEQINQANYFQIYENTNNPQDVSASRFVDYATTQSLGNSQVIIGSESYTAPLQISSSGSYYFDQKYSNISQTDWQNFTPLVSFYDTGAEAGVPVIANTTRILFKNETSGSIIDSSPYNGVFIFIETLWEANSTGSSTGTMTVRWQRASDAYYWANFIDKVFYINGGTSSGLNFQSNAAANGVINSTPLLFTVEDPVQLYPDVDDWIGQNFGTVYKNSVTQTFIKPFTGLQSDMLFLYNNNNTSNNLSILSVNSDNWSITHSALSSPLIPGTVYRIMSYFKTSDENPFYAYTTPKLTIEDADSNSSWEEVSSGEYIISNRYISVKGIYEQAQKSWKSFQWQLTNLNLNLTSQTETMYSGDITATFRGLQNAHNYILTLIVEDELGLVISTSINFQVQVTVESGDFPLSLQLNCKTQSVDIDFFKYGLIIPQPSSSVSFLKYTDGQLNIVPDVNLKEQEYGVNYSQISTLDFDGDAATEKLMGPSDTSFTINSQHILNPYFQGGVIETVINTTPENATTLQRIKVKIILPPNTIIDSNNQIVVNPTRNQILGYYCVEQSKDNGTSWYLVPQREEYTVFYISQNNTQSNTWRRNYDTQDNFVTFSLMQSVPTQPRDCDYLLTTIPYNIQVNGELIQGAATQYLNLTGINCINGLLRFPLSSLTLDQDYSQFFVQPTIATSPIPFYTVDNNEFWVLSPQEGTAVWTDFATVLATQLNGEENNVMDIENPIYWDDDIGYWSDALAYKEGTLYFPIDVNSSNTNFSGRQEINNYILTFNFVIENYDPKLTTVSSPLTLTGQCFMNIKSGGDNGPTNNANNSLSS